MKTMLCVLALFVLTSTSADAYVRRTIGGGHVVRGVDAHSGRYAGGSYGRGYYGHPVARGDAAATGAAVAAGAATGRGWNQPYYGGGYGAYASSGYRGFGGVSSKDHDTYMKNLHDSGYDPKNDYTAVGTIKAQ